MLWPLNLDWSALHRQVGIILILAGFKVVRPVGRIDITADGVVVGELERMV